MVFISREDRAREDLKEFRNALDNIDTSLMDTNTGWDRNKDDELFGWIEYTFEGEKENLVAKGQPEIYVPGIIRTEESEENYFVPVIWPEEKDDIRDRIQEQTGAEKFSWRPKNDFYAEDRRGRSRDPRKEVFDIALIENDIDLEPGFDEEAEVETWPETGAVQVDYSGGRRFYGYVKEHKKQFDMDSEPIETEAEIVARLDPYGELGEISGNNYFNAAHRIAKIDSDIESIDQVKFDGTYVSDLEWY